MMTRRWRIHLASNGRRGKKQSREVEIESESKNKSNNHDLTQLDPSCLTAYYLAAASQTHYALPIAAARVHSMTPLNHVMTSAY
jgi:hypothetical protein